MNFRELRGNRWTHFDQLRYELCKDLELGEPATEFIAKLKTHKPSAHGYWIPKKTKRNVRKG